MLDISLDLIDRHFGHMAAGRVAKAVFAATDTPFTRNLRTTAGLWLDDHFPICAECADHVILPGNVAVHPDCKKAQEEYDRQVVLSETCMDCPERLHSPIEKVMGIHNDCLSKYAQDFEPDFGRASRD